MENPVSDFLGRYGAYSKEDLVLLEAELDALTLEKGEILLSKGDTCSSLCFLVTGSAYQYGIEGGFNEKVIDLYVPNDWVINHKSFASRKPSDYFIKAYEDTSLYTLSMEAIHKLIGHSQSFFQLGKILGESGARISFFDNDMTPDEKYQEVLKNKPEVIQKFPQKLIASYLKITPETLSRVRSRFSKS